MDGTTSDITMFRSLGNYPDAAKLSKLSIFGYSSSNPTSSNESVYQEICRRRAINPNSVTPLTHYRRRHFGSVKNNRRPNSALPSVKETTAPPRIIRDRIRTYFDEIQRKTVPRPSSEQLVYVDVSQQTPRSVQKPGNWKSDLHLTSKSGRSRISPRSTSTGGMKKWVVTGVNPPNPSARRSPVLPRNQQLQLYRQQSEEIRHKSYYGEQHYYTDTDRGTAYKVSPLSRPPPIPLSSPPVIHPPASPRDLGVSVQDRKAAYFADVSQSQRLVTSSEEIDKVLKEENLRVTPSPGPRTSSPFYYGGSLDRRISPREKRHRPVQIQHRPPPRPPLSPTPTHPKHSPIYVGPVEVPSSAHLSVKQRTLIYLRAANASSASVRSTGRSRSEELPHMNHPRVLHPQSEHREHSAPPAVYQSQESKNYQIPDGYSKLRRSQPVTYSIQDTISHAQYSHSLNRPQARKRISDQDPHLTRTVSETELVRGNASVPGNGMRNAYLLRSQDATIPPSHTPAERLSAVGQIREIYDRDSARGSVRSQGVRFQSPVKRKVGRPKLNALRKSLLKEGTVSSGEIEQMKHSKASQQQMIHTDISDNTTPPSEEGLKFVSQNRPKFESLSDRNWADFYAWKRSRLSKNLPPTQSMESSVTVASAGKDSGSFTVAVYDGSQQANHFRPISITPTQEMHDSKIMQQGSLSQGSSASYSQQKQYSSSTLERSHQHMLHQARGSAAYRQQMMSNGGTQIVSERTPVSYRQEKIVYENTPKPSEFVSERVPYLTPSVGQYTQLDMPPEPSVVENEPVSKHVDAKYGHHTELIATNVRNLREHFRDRPESGPEIKRTGRTWQQADGIPWEPLGGTAPPTTDTADRRVSVAQQRQTASSTVIEDKQQLEAEKTAYLLRQIHVQRELSKTPTPRYPLASFDGPVSGSRPPSATPLLPTVAPPPLLAQKAVSSTKAPPLPPPKSISTISERISAAFHEENEPGRRKVSFTRRNVTFAPNAFSPAHHRTEMQREQDLFRQESRQLLQERERLEQQQLYEQYQKEELERQERIRKQQQEFLARQRREEEEIRMRQERDRRQFLLKQQEMQQQMSIETSLEQQQRVQQHESRLRTGSLDRSQVSQISPGGTTWKRTYVIEPKEDVVKNEIRMSEDLLKDESYYIDLLARRDTFLEKLQPPPPINYVGKVWQPPPDKPPSLPGPRQPQKEFVPIDDKEHKWEPYILEPEFKYERKNFTPEPSPPPRRRSVRQAPTPQQQTIAQNTSIPLPPLQIRDLTPIPLRPPPPRQHGGDPGLDVKMRVIHRPPSVTPSETSSLSAPMYVSEPNLPQRVVQTPSISMEASPKSHRRTGSYDPRRTPQYAETEGSYGPSNEPTSRHPSTITVTERPPSVNILRRINVFEPRSDSRGPRGKGYREFSSRPSATSSLSLDDDVFGEGGSSRAVRFADRSNVIMHNSNQPVDLYLREQGENQFQMKAYPHTQQMGLPPPPPPPPPPPTDQHKQQIVYEQRRSSSESDVRRRIGGPPPQTSTPKRDQDLDELTRLREELLERSKYRSSDYKLTMQDIQKMEAPQSAPNVKDRVRDLLETKSTTSSSTKAPLSSSGGAATESVATWQFSSHSFSPRSVISVNGHKDDGGLLRVRTDLSPPSRPQTIARSNAAVQTTTSEQPQAPFYPYPAVLVPIPNQSPASTATREYREDRRGRYTSLPDLHDDYDKQSTLIKVQDERSRKPKSIMKQRRDMEAWERAASADTGPRMTTEIIKHGPHATEIIQQTEETTRTEEIERKVREKEKKRTRKGERKHHREGHRSYHHSNTWGHSPNTGQVDDPPWTVPFEEKGTVTETEQEAPPVPAKKTAVSSKMVQVVEKKSSGSQADFPLKTVVVEKVVESQSQAPMWKRQAITANGFAASEGYQPHVSEGYTRQTTTKRVQEGGSSSTHSRHGSSSLTDSLRRRDATYMPNGEIHLHGSSGRRHKGQRVHKSHSSRDVYHNEMPEDYLDDPRGPIVEFPPTLPRGQRPAHYSSGSSITRNTGNVHKSRSFADWEDGARYNKDGEVMRRWDNDMTQLERDFRDTLLMPMPGLGQTVDEKEYRQEEIPGGHESLRRETTANTGRKQDPMSGGDTHFSESKQEIHYKKELAGDGKRR